MRRRIDTHDIRDASKHPHHKVHDLGDGPVVDDEVYPVLRNEELWQRLEAARATVDELEQQVRAELVEEPFDATECEIALKLHDLMTHWNSAAWDALVTMLLEHYRVT